jgi:hypothetical protein
MSKNAYATIHFGSNPVYLELELYFFIMLRKYTANDILYLYSATDTPKYFVDAVRPFVTDVVPYDDTGITYNVKFESGYTNFNTLRTCNFIFAYNLEKYEKVCIIESDMVIMNNIDSIFELNAPAVLSYYISNPTPENEKIVHKQILNTNVEINNNPEEVLARCNQKGRLNGGVMLIEPTARLFEKYIEKIQDIVRNTCKYPNETLFEYVNNAYYNLPVRYNLSHYHAKPNNLKNYKLSKDDILVFHFNETNYKHLDTIKNPIDEKGENWLDIYRSTTDPKYVIKKIPVLHYKDFVYDENHGQIEDIILGFKPAKNSIRTEDLHYSQPPSPKETPPSSSSLKEEKKDQKTQKWIDRVNDLVRRISDIQTKKRLFKFHTNYIQPILEITKTHKLNIIIKNKIKELTDAYELKMSEMPSSETKKKKKRRKNSTQKDL